MIDKTAISDDSRYLAAGSENGMIYLFDLIDKDKMISWTVCDDPQEQEYRDSVFLSRNGRVWGLIALPNNRGFISSDDIGYIKIWNTSGKMMAQARHGRREITSLVISPNGKILATGGTVDSIMLWDLEEMTKKQ